MRQRKGLTLDQVAQRMGVRKPNVSQLEHGILDVTDPYIQRYAKSVGISAARARAGYWQAVWLRCRERMRQAEGFGAGAGGNKKES